MLIRTEHFKLESNLSYFLNQFLAIFFILGFNIISVSIPPPTPTTTPTPLTMICCSFSSSVHLLKELFRLLNTCKSLLREKATMVWREILSFFHSHPLTLSNPNGSVAGACNPYYSLLKCGHRPQYSSLVILSWDLHYTIFPMFASCGSPPMSDVPVSLGYTQRSVGEMFNADAIDGTDNPRGSNLKFLTAVPTTCYIDSPATVQNVAATRNVEDDLGKSEGSEQVAHGQDGQEGGKSEMKNECGKRHLEKEWCRKVLKSVPKPKRRRWNSETTTINPRHLCFIESRKRKNKGKKKCSNNPLPKESTLQL